MTDDLSVIPSCLYKTMHYGASCTSVSDEKPFRLQNRQSVSTVICHPLLRTR